MIAFDSNGTATVWFTELEGTPGKYSMTLETYLMLVKLCGNVAELTASLVRRLDRE